jgi:hypothetical protein
MGLEDKHKIDAIVEDPDDGPVRLLMMEHREWTLSEEQIEQLEDKISAYYNFFVTGQLRKVLPSSVTKKCVVELHCQFEPPKKIMDQFPDVAALFAKQSIAFRVFLVRELGGSAATLPLYPV